MHARKKSGDPFLLNRVGRHSHLLGHTSTVDCECNIAQANEHTVLEKIRSPKSGQRKVRNVRVDVFLRRRIAFLDAERFAEGLLRP